MVAGLGYLFAGLVDAKMLLSLLSGSIPAVAAGSLLAGRVGWASASIRSSRPNFPSRISGDAFITQIASAISHFRVEFRSVELNSWNLATA